MLYNFSNSSKKIILSSFVLSKNFSVYVLDCWCVADDSKMSAIQAENQAPSSSPYVVETITTMTTTITEHRIITTAEDDELPPPKPPKAVTLQPPALPEGRSSVLQYASSQSVENMKSDMNATVIPKFNVNGTTAQAITGILKGGKLRKTDSIQVNTNPHTLMTDVEIFQF